MIFLIFLVHIPQKIVVHVILCPQSAKQYKFNFVILFCCSEFAVSGEEFYLTSLQFLPVEDVG